MSDAVPATTAPEIVSQAPADPATAVEPVPEQAASAPAPAADATPAVAAVEPAATAAAPPATAAAEKAAEVEELSEVLHPRGTDGKPLAELQASLGGSETIPAVFDEAMARHADKPFAGWRANGGAAPDFTWTTFAQFGADVLAMCHALSSPRLALEGTDGPDTPRMVGIFSPNRYEWPVVDVACAACGVVTVPLYDSLGAERVAMVVGETRLSAVFCARDKVPVLLEAAAQCPSLHALVQLPDEQGADATTIDAAAASTAPGVQIVAYSTLLSEGRAAVAAGAPSPRKAEVRPDDLFTIIYTSGTSGRPKGAMISHRNLLSGAGGVLARHGSFFGEETLLSFLPLAHVLERQILYLEIKVGARVGFFSGSTSRIMQDLKALRPTIFFGVPRLYSRIYSGVMARVAGMPFYKRWLFGAAFSRKAAVLSAPGSVPLSHFHSRWDFVFSMVRENTGGRIKLMVTGSAALPDEVHRAMQVMFGCPVVQGYGMTEAYAVSVHNLDDATLGHCGPVMPNSELRLRSVPELGYSVKDTPYPRGEALVRGPHVFCGYYKHPELTADVMTPDGWLCTGDIAEILPGERIRVIDRRREMFKLAQGEYLSAERLESVYGRCPLASQLFVYGDASRSCLVAVVVPEEAQLRAAAKADAAVPFAELCASPKAKQAVLDSFAELHAAAKMTGLERVYSVHLDHEAFSVENGLLTPTNKLSRPAARRHYAEVIEQLYKSVAEKK